MKELLLAVSILLIALGINTLTFWGVGNLVIYAFNIDYTWTILHGFVFALVWNIVKGLFSND